MQNKTVRYYLTPIGLVNFSSSEHGSADTVVEWRQGSVRDARAVKYTLTTPNNQRRTLHSAMPILAISLERQQVGVLHAIFTVTLRPHLPFSFSFSWVPGEVFQSRMMFSQQTDRRCQWDSSFLLLIQTLKDFQKCKSNTTPLTVFLNIAIFYRYVMVT